MGSTTTWTTTIAKPPADVFAVLSDFTRHHEWSPTNFTAKQLTEGPVGVGTEFETHGWLPGKGKEFENHVTVTAYEPGKRFAFDAKDPRGPVIPSDFVLTPDGTGTKVSRTMTMPKPDGFQGVLWPVIFPMLVKPAIQKNLNKFKDVVEGGGAPAA
ncbi:MAG TPA: SRPBCC family protein [Actinomycetota bacterium]|jgi:uncharacterized protein YndB with AHSA1/START domain